MATVAEVKNRAAEILGILAVGQTLASHHDTRLGQAYDEVYEAVKEDGLNIWASDGTVPDRIVEPFAGLMVLNAIPTYPLSVARYKVIVDRFGSDGEKAWREIRKQLTPTYISTDDRRDF